MRLQRGRNKRKLDRLAQFTKAARHIVLRDFNLTVDDHA